MESNLRSYLSPYIFFFVGIHPLPYLTYQIHTDLFHVQVGLVVDGHSSVTIIHCAERCPRRVVFNKWVMFFKTALKK